MSSSSKQDDYELFEQDKLFELDDSMDPVSMETHISSNNIGYKMLQKMGWTQGKGLGTQGQGRVDPIRIEVKDDSLGVGKAEEYQQTHISTTSKRKALDSEKQLEESEQQRLEREQRVQKKQAIQKELEQVKRAFYCELCDKQYKKISEFEQHLQSYDHHHKKRFKDMKESARNSIINQSEREKKLARERKREEKELKRMQEAIQRKAGINNNSSNGNIPTVTNTTITSTSTSTSERERIIPNNSNETTNSTEGWTITQNTSSNSITGGGWASIPPSNKPLINNPKLPTIPAANTLLTKNDSNHNSAPKKLSFGLKKTNGFQFGLKKK